MPAPDAGLLAGRVVMLGVFFFSSRRRHTRCSRDWSSDVCSSDLHIAALTFSKEPGGGAGAAALKEGRLCYDAIGCRKCHGDQGHGDGPSAPTLKDDAGFPIYAADLHQSWRFRGGPTAADIYRRLRTGLDGTPMPSFSDLIDRKSTRLNSSHGYISYAVFCLKKKKTKKQQTK